MKKLWTLGGKGAFVEFCGSAEIAPLDHIHGCRVMPGLGGGGLCKERWGAFDKPGLQHTSQIGSWYSQGGGQPLDTIVPWLVACSQ